MNKQNALTREYIEKKGKIVVLILVIVVGILLLAYARVIYYNIGLMLAG